MAFSTLSRGCEVKLRYNNWNQESGKHVQFMYRVHAVERMFQRDIEYDVIKGTNYPMKRILLTGSNGFVGTL